jgi:hypothetical protein
MLLHNKPAHNLVAKIVDFITDHKSKNVQLYWSGESSANAC